LFIVNTLKVNIIVTEIGATTLATVVLHAGKYFACAVGDSGFVVLRPGAVSDGKVTFALIYKSIPQLRTFNCPVQISTLLREKLMETQGETEAVSAFEHEIRYMLKNIPCFTETARQGDIVIAFSDGLLDNIDVSGIIDAAEAAARDCSGQINGAAYRSALVSRLVRSASKKAFTRPWAPDMERFFSLQCDAPRQPKTIDWRTVWSVNALRTFGDTASPDKRAPQSQAQVSPAAPSNGNNPGVVPCVKDAPKDTCGTQGAYMGGKPDDITVVVGIVAPRNGERQAATGNCRPASLCSANTAALRDFRYRYVPAPQREGVSGLETALSRRRVVGARSGAASLEVPLPAKPILSSATSESLPSPLPSPEKKTSPRHAPTVAAVSPPSAGIALPASRVASPCLLSPRSLPLSTSPVARIPTRTPPAVVLSPQRKNFLPANRPTVTSVSTAPPAENASRPSSQDVSLHDSDDRYTKPKASHTPRIAYGRSPAFTKDRLNFTRGASAEDPMKERRGSSVFPGQKTSPNGQRFRERNNPVGALRFNSVTQPPRAPQFASPPVSRLPNNAASPSPATRRVSPHSRPRLQPPVVRPGFANDAAVKSPRVSNVSANISFDWIEAAGDGLLNEVAREMAGRRAPQNKKSSGV